MKLFVWNLQPFYKIRRVLNLIHVREGGPDTATVSLNVAKSVDSVDWSYLFEALSRVGLSVYNRKWTEILYTDPLVEVSINYLISSLLNLSRAMECFATAVRSQPLISGIKMCDSEHRLVMYADDTLLLLQLKSQLHANLDQILKQMKQSHLLCFSTSRSGYTQG